MKEVEADVNPPHLVAAITKVQVQGGVQVWAEENKLMVHMGIMKWDFIGKWSHWEYHIQEPNKMASHTTVASEQKQILLFGAGAEAVAEAEDHMPPIA